MGSVPNLCWKCGKACTRGCKWSDSFSPIDGWNAIEDVKNNSYLILRCPEFVPDTDSKRDYDIDGCKNLATAIVLEAVKDYKRASKYDDEYAIEMRRDVERFIRSKSFARMLSIDQKWLIRKLRERK